MDTLEPSARTVRVINAQTVELLAEDLIGHDTLREAVEAKLAKIFRAGKSPREEILFIEGEELTPGEQELLRELELEIEFAVRPAPAARRSA